MYYGHNNAYHDPQDVVMRVQPQQPQGFPGEDHHYYSPQLMHFPFTCKKKSQVPLVPLAPSPRYIYQEDLTAYPHQFVEPPSYFGQHMYVEPKKKYKRPRSPVLPYYGTGPVPEKQWFPQEIEAYAQLPVMEPPPPPPPFSVEPQFNHIAPAQAPAGVSFGASPVIPIQGLGFSYMPAAVPGVQSAQPASQPAPVAFGVSPMMPIQGLPNGTTIAQTQLPLAQPTGGVAFAVSPVMTTQGLSYMPTVTQVQPFPVLPVTYASPVVLPVPLQDVPPQAPQAAPLPSAHPVQPMHQVERPVVDPAYAHAPTPPPTGPVIRPHRALQLGHVRVDMSKPSLSEALPSSLFNFMNSPASEPNVPNIQLRCDAFNNPLSVSGHGRVTIGQVLEAIHKQVHTPIDEDNSPSAQAQQNVTHSGRRSFFDRVRCLDLLHGQHHFIGLKESEGATWTILFD